MAGQHVARDKSWSGLFVARPSTPPGGFYGALWAKISLGGRVGGPVPLRGAAAFGGGERIPLAARFEVFHPRLRAGKTALGGFARGGLDARVGPLIVCVGVAWARHFIMPIYVYQCQQCGAIEEHIQGFKDDPMTTCEACGGELRKSVTSAAFHLKGGGWYKDGYASSGAADNSSAAAADKGSSADSSSGGDSGSSSSGDSSGSSSSGASSSGSSSSGDSASSKKPSKPSVS